MSRTKKSRKPGAGSNGAVKEEKKKLATPVPKRIRKKAGKQAGNRQQEAKTDQQNNTDENQNKDPRLGSKTPIVLTKAVESKSKVAKAKQESRTPIPALRPVEPEQPNQQALLLEELENIEQDERLQVLLTKQEDEISLSENDIEYFNTLMERHEQISNELGLEDDGDEGSSVNTTDKSEDQLWDKLDNGDLSDYQ